MAQVWPYFGRFQPDLENFGYLFNEDKKDHILIPLDQEL